MKVISRRLLEEQIAGVVVPGRGEKNDAKWHVPHHDTTINMIIILLYL